MNGEDDSCSDVHKLPGVLAVGHEPHVEVPEMREYTALWATHIRRLYATLWHGFSKPLGLY